VPGFPHEPQAGRMANRSDGGGRWVSAEAGEHREFGPLGGALRLRFASLPTRIIVAVFSAALVTGLAVTMISTRSTETSLRSKIDGRFPDLLRTTSRDLEQWYAQRELDIATFASSDTLANGLLGGEHTALAAHRYLSYVQDGFPQYRGLFVLDVSGERRAAVGVEVELPGSLLERLASIETITTSDALGPPEGRFQLISAPILRGQQRIGTLHAVLGVVSIDALLSAEEMDSDTGLYVVSSGAQVLASRNGSSERDTFERPLPAPDAAPVVEDYTTPADVHVVGSALRMGRFDWTIVVEQDYQVAFAPVVSVMGKVMAINLGIVAAFGVLALLIARSIVHPIRALSDVARRIANGETEVEIPRASGQDEIGVLSQALHEMVDRLRSSQVELQRKQNQIERANADLTQANADLSRNNEMLEQLSFTDGLTHLHNHRYFQDRLRIETKRADRTGDPVSLLLLDIDDFKALNDRYGHAVGDEVLRRVATILNNGVRESDLPARYGGEEFAVLSPRTPLKGAIALAEKLRLGVADARIRNLEEPGSERVAVTVSIGVSVYRGDFKRFFNEADRALYRAKGSGKDCVVVFSEPD
jgi:diguanylate cyclase (GGDEF)-like protein